MREYEDYIRIMLKDGDRENIQRRMKEAGIINMSAYIRKMAIDGLVVNLDLSDLKEVSRLMRIETNNMNQVAKRMNETGNIYLIDIKESQDRLDEVIGLLKDIKGRLSSIS